VGLLGGSSLSDINQILMEIEVKRLQSFCYEQLSLAIVLFCFGIYFWVSFTNVFDTRRKNA
jgi:hypothetical protein